MFDFPIKKSADLIYFLDSLNDKHYREIMVCTDDDICKNQV